MASYCRIYRASDECWYLDLNEDGANPKKAKSWGPFQVKDYAQQYLAIVSKTVSEFETDESLKAAPPKISPDGSPVQIPDYHLIRVASAPCEFYKIEFGTTRQGDIFYLYCPKDQVIELAHVIAAGHGMRGSLQNSTKVDNLAEIYLFWNTRKKLVKRANTPLEE